MRRTTPAEVPRLHRAAAQWLAVHGFPVEAVRHAQAARDWPVAARLLTDHWVSLYLVGQLGAAQELLAAFPADIMAIDAELTALKALGDVDRGSPEEAERHLARAARGLESGDGLVPPERRGRLEILLSMVRLRLAGEHVDPRAVAEEADRLLVLDETAAASLSGLGADLRPGILVNPAPPRPGPGG